MAEVGDIVRVNIHHTLPNTSEAQNVFYWQIGGQSIDDEDMLDDILSWVTTFWASAWRDIAAPSASMDYFEADLVNVNGTVQQNLGVRQINIAGDAPGTTIAAAVSGYLMASTLLPKGRGSKYIPGLAETSTSEGEWSPATVLELGQMLLAYLATINATGGTQLVPGISSRTVQQFVPFLSQGLVETIPAYQRRRKPGVGS